MLTSLHIENIAVIRKVDLEFGKGFSVLTGETGAGKSMIIDSINLLLGNRVSRELIRTGSDGATVAATFEELPDAIIGNLEKMGFSVEDGMLMLQKSITRDGKSQCKLNGQTITQSMQREISSMLIGIHGQSDSQQLMQKSAHLRLLDDFAKPEKELSDYKEIYNRWRQVKQKLDGFQKDGSEKLRLIEMLKYQISDIDAVRLRPGEEEKLTKERDLLLHAEQIDRQAGIAYALLSGGEKASAKDLIAKAENALRGLFGIVDGAQELAERLAEAKFEIADIAETVQGYLSDDREDPTAKIDKLESRLEAIARLKRKYGATVEEVLSFRDRAEAELNQTDCSEEAKKRCEEEEKKLRISLQKAGEILHLSRERAAKVVESEVEKTLFFLDMPKVRFHIRISAAEPRENGCDDVEFLIATNPGEPLLPLIKIASGGELSRIMLALRSVLDNQEGSSGVIFDEIDAGISGKTSRKVGMKLKDIAKKVQVLCVTHSAQIASLADAHYLISKTEEDGRAETGVKLLSDSERVEEIARILGGIEITSAQRDAAREMIEEF